MQVKNRKGLIIKVQTNHSSDISNTKYLLDNRNWSNITIKMWISINKYCTIEPTKEALTKFCLNYPSNIIKTSHLWTTANWNKRNSLALPTVWIGFGAKDLPTLSTSTFQHSSPTTGSHSSTEPMSSSQRFPRPIPLCLTKGCLSSPNHQASPFLIP